MKKTADFTPLHGLLLASGIATILMLSACANFSPPVIPTPTNSSPSPTLAPTQTHTFTTTLTATNSPSPVPSQTPSLTATSTATPFPSDTPTPLLTPTYAVLRGKVLVRSNCRYGPGAPYLYKYGLVAGSNLEVIGRTDSGKWILVQAIGGNNPCWVKADLMEVKGDVMAVEPTYIPLPRSPYYAPPTGVSASRADDQVTVFWNAFGLRAGDDTASAPILVEAWVCVDGQLVFTPVGSYQTAVAFTDEPGCTQPSHGWVYGVEKHGYTKGVEIPWPAP